MRINSATFVKGVVGPDEILASKKPHVALLGRSNVGKSSTINALTRTKGLAHSSSTPGRTRELNVYLINKAFYLVDLPGYGFSAASKGEGKKNHRLIDWYLFEQPSPPSKVVMIIDANVGLTADDIEMFLALERKPYEIIIAANKVDRLKQSVAAKQLQKIRDRVGAHEIFPYSAKKLKGVGELGNAILK